MTPSYEGLKYKLMKDLNKSLESIHEKINEVNNELADECKARELLEQAFGNFVKRIDSKIENSQTVGNIMLDIGNKNKERINGMATAIGEMAGHAAQALNQAKKTDEKFNRLWMRIFFAIIGSTLLSQVILFSAFFIFKEK